MSSSCPWRPCEALVGAAAQTTRAEQRPPLLPLRGGEPARRSTPALARPSPSAGPQACGTRPCCGASPAASARS
eukprot:7376627-Pyramimonas_sp.AAC.1